MYAIVETGGKQFRGVRSDVIRTDLIENRVGFVGDVRTGSSSPPTATTCRSARRW